MWQYLVLNIDKRHRLRALTPNASPSNLNYSLFPNGVPKTLFDTLLFVSGTEGGTSGTEHLNFDPYVTDTFASDLAADAEDPFAIDFFGYHSADYFYNGKSFATNGGAGTTTLTPPAMRVPKVNAMVWNGVRDGLFNFNNAYHNYVGLQTGGGDVRLLSYQAGHNSLTGAPPDPGASLYYPSGDIQDSRCGVTLDEDVAQLEWMNQYLKNIPNSIGNIPTMPCVSLSAGDAVLVPALPVAALGNGTSFDIGSLSVISGAPVDVPVSASLYTAGPAGDVYVGIPHVHLTITTTAPVGVGTPVIFAGIGQLHASNPATWDLVDNQITPIRGVGTIDLDLVGGGTRLLPGDKLGLLIYRLHDQYAATGSVNVAAPTVEPLTVTGTVSIPLLGTSPASF